MKNFNIAILSLVTALAISSCIHTSKDVGTIPPPSKRRGLASDENSLEQQLRTVDPKKKTACTITINSDDETRIFRENLTAFNFLELTAPKGNWFKKACDNKVQCDVVLISGHFGGTFFGESNLTLPLADLEEFSCEANCAGVFGKATEVFLFGCNTLAGKDKDRRSPEEYIRVLMNDGFSRMQAEQIAGFRYSPIGASFRDRMSSVFYGAQRIYGFDSIGPSGKTVEPMLKNYFRGVGEYGKHLEAVRSSKAPNATLARALATTSLAEARGTGGTIQNIPSCLMTGEQSRLEKLQWILNQLKNPKTFVESSSYIKMFFSGDAEEREKQMAQLSAEEARIWDQIRRDAPTNGKSRQQVYGLLAKPVPGVIAMQSQLASLAQSLDWASKTQYDQWMKQLIGDLKQPMTIERKNYICSLGATMEISIGDLPPSPWNEPLITVIGCLKPQNQDVSYTLLYELYEERIGQPQMKKGWVEFDEIGEAAKQALNRIKPKDERARTLIRQGLNSRDERKKSIALSIYPEGLFEATAARALLLPLLKESHITVRNQASNTLYGEKLHTAETLGPLLSDPDQDFVINTMDFLTERGLWNEELVRKGVQLLRDPNRMPVRANAELYLSKLKRPELDEEVARARNNPTFYGDKYDPAQER